MNDGNVSLARGQELLAQKQPARALAVFEALVRLNAMDIDAQVGRAAALLQTGQAQEALRVCDEILATHPGRPGVMPMKITALMALSRYDAARYMLKHHLWNQNDAALLWHLGGKLLRLDDQLDLAMDSFDMALSRNPDFCDALMDKGRTLARLNRFEDAAWTFERVIHLQPDNAEARQAWKDAKAGKRQSDVRETLLDVMTLLDFLGTILFS